MIDGGCGKANHAIKLQKNVSNILSIKDTFNPLHYV